MLFYENDDVMCIHVVDKQNDNGVLQGYVCRHSVFLYKVTALYRLKLKNNIIIKKLYILFFIKFVTLIVTTTNCTNNNLYNKLFTVLTHKKLFFFLHV